MEIIALLFIASIVMGVVAAIRGRNVFGWFFLSLLISPLLAVILLLVLPSKKVA